MIHRISRLLPASSCVTWIQQIRNLRPSIKMGVNKFEITINVHQFTRDELRVKARPEYVIIEGKQERETKRGYVLRQFSRKFKLPEGCTPEKVVSKLSPDGTLTITAHREQCSINLPCETLVPIGITDETPDVSLVEVNEKLSSDHCQKLISDTRKKLEECRKSKQK